MNLPSARPLKPRRVPFSLPPKITDLVTDQMPDRLQPATEVVCIPICLGPDREVISHDAREPFICQRDGFEYPNRIDNVRIVLPSGAGRHMLLQPCIICDGFSLGTVVFDPARVPVAHSDRRRWRKAGGGPCLVPPVLRLVPLQMIVSEAVRLDQMVPSQNM